jgi:polysaccharide biosynthesis protein PslJ
VSIPPAPVASDASVPGRSRPKRALRHVLASTDGTTVLTLYIALLLIFPARYVFAPLGAAGAPAQIFSIVITLWWGSHGVSRTKTRHFAPRPISHAMLLMSASVLASYVIATTRAMSQTETNGADRALLELLGWLGIVLVAGNLIPTQARLDVLLRRTVALGGFLGALGIAQFLTGRAFTQYLRLPGLAENAELASVLAREGLNRSAGTATHPIEFGVVIAMILPLAAHYAIHDTARPLVRRLIPLLLMVFAIPTSVSRSSILCNVIVLVFLVPSWETRIRRLSYAAIPIFGSIIFVTVPGLLGTLLGLFSGISEDASARSRWDSYGAAFTFIVHRPFLGRGPATFLPQYTILDNQYLMTTIETGLVGLLCLIMLLGTGILVGLGLRARSRNPAEKSLAISLTASLAAGSLSLAFFDAFSFGMVSGFLFFVLGSLNALHHLRSAEGVRIARDVDRSTFSPATGAFAIAALQLDPSDLDKEDSGSRSARHARQEDV